MNERSAGQILIEQQTRALLALIEADRARQCAQILDAASAKADAQRAKAHADARARMRQTFAEQRLRRRERIAAVQAQLATQRRLHAQQRSAALLRLAWQQLPDALLALWREPASRAAWVAHAARFARARLPGGVWRIVYAPDGSPQPQHAPGAEWGAAAQFHADPAISAGLRIETDGNVVDATLGGLLADRTEIEARLLRLLEDHE